MANTIEPGEHERPSTYVVQDRQNQEELLRLTIQDQMITAGMGGVLPEQANPAAFHRVLDVACGTGGWAIEAASIYPEMQLIGIDVSKSMIEYARERAEAQHVADRVEFHVMDALLILEFPANFFDLVNLRFGISFLRTWDWLKMLSELQRVTRAGGVIRVTDEEVVNPSNSPALTQLFGAWQQGLFSAGHLFEEETTGLIAHIPELFARCGIQQVQTKKLSLEFRAGTPQGQAYYDDMRHAFHNIRPFLDRRGCTPENYDAIYQQALSEMQEPDFRVGWNLLTVWGNKLKNSKPQRRD